MSKIAVRGRSFLACIALLMQAAYFPAAYPFALLADADFSNGSAWSDDTLGQGLSFAIHSDFLTQPGDPGNAERKDAVRNAFGTWAAANSRLSFIEGTFTWQNPAIGSRIDIFSEDRNFDYLGTEFNDALAMTLVLTGFDGSIVGVDMYFNEYYIDEFSSGEFDVESIALHEIGHALGLAHPDKDATGAPRVEGNYDSLGNEIPSSGSEIMHSSIARWEISRSLTGDELAGLYHLYPADFSFGTDITSTAIQPTSVPEPGTALLAAAGGLLLLGFSQRRRRAYHGAV